MYNEDAAKIVASMKRKRRLRRKKRRRHGYSKKFLLRQEETAAGYGRPLPNYGPIVSPYEEWYIQREVPEMHHMSIPDAAHPSLTKEYIEKELDFLPEAFRKNMYRRSIDLRVGKIIRYLKDTYGYVPPRINRLVTGSYHHNSHGDQGGLPPQLPPQPQPPLSQLAPVVIQQQQNCIENTNQAVEEAEMATGVLNSALQSVAKSLSSSSANGNEKCNKKQQQRSTPAPPAPAAARYVKRMMIPHKKSMMPPSFSDNDEDDDDEETAPPPSRANTHSTIKKILNDFCDKKANTKTTVHKIMDIANSVAKVNIR